MSRSNVTLRSYQVLAHEAIVDGFTNYRKQLLIMPTGSGKTIQFAALAEHYQPFRTLVLAHREELIFQAVEKLQKVTGLSAEIDMGNRHASSLAPIVVASIQTLFRKDRLMKWPADHFGLVVVDEAHHALSESYLRILNYFHEKAFVLGVTATPDRSDKKNLGSYFENIAYEITLLDLIKQNWLSSIRVETVPLSLDLRGVRTTSGDYNQEDAGHAIEPYLERIAEIMWKYRHRKTIVFLPLIEISKKFTKLCRAVGITAEHLDGNSVNRVECLERFKQGITRLLSNAMLLTEGYDEPSIDCVVCLRPTKCRALYSQMVGRGTRLWPGKNHLLLLDFLWLTQEHSLVRPTQLIAGDIAEANLIEEALKQDGDLAAAHSRVMADRTQRLSELLKSNSSRKARVFNALEFAVAVEAPDLADFMPTMKWHDDPVSFKQADLLNRCGVDPETVECKGQAAAILDKIFLRRHLGLATARQVRLLSKLRYPQPWLASFEEAQTFLRNRFEKQQLKNISNAI